MSGVFISVRSVRFRDRNMDYNLVWLYIICKICQKKSDEFAGMSGILISGIYLVGFPTCPVFQNNINGNFDGFPPKK